MSSLDVGSAGKTNGGCRKSRTRENLMFKGSGIEFLCRETICIIVILRPPEVYIVST